MTPRSVRSKWLIPTRSRGVRLKRVQGAAQDTAAQRLAPGKKPAGSLPDPPSDVPRLLVKEGGQIQGLSPMPTSEKPHFLSVWAYSTLTHSQPV